MTVRREGIIERLKELDNVVQELRQYENLDAKALHASLGQRWVIERGLIAASALLFDVADHILAGQFGIYPQTYEESLTARHEQKVISDDLYSQLKGLGGLRNILVHQYQAIDPQQVWDNYRKGLSIFPLFSREILLWLDMLNH